MQIPLTKQDIELSIEKLARPLEQYLWIQVSSRDRGIRQSPEFRKRYNHFYRVRRNLAWQQHYYSLLEKLQGTNPTFPQVLVALQDATTRCETSFASKLIATINPHLPVIDSVVLVNVGAKLPPHTTRQRRDKILKLYEDLVACFGDFLKTPLSDYMLKRFKQAYPNAEVTPTKVLDLVLWQRRA